MTELLIGALFLGVFVGVPLALVIWLVVYAGRRATIYIGECRACHYDLRGSLESGRCPECGRPFRINQNGDAVS